VQIRWAERGGCLTSAPSRRLSLIAFERIDYFVVDGIGDECSTVRTICTPSFYPSRKRSVGGMDGGGRRARRIVRAGERLTE